MKCEKCGSENTTVVCRPIRAHARHIVIYTVLFTLVVVLFCFAFYKVSVAFSAMNKLENSGTVEELLGNFQNAFREAIAAVLIALVSLLVFSIIIGFRFLMDARIETQIIGVCLDCGKTWVIPAKLKEFNEDDIHAAKLAQRERLEARREGQDDVLGHD